MYSFVKTPIFIIKEIFMILTSWCVLTYTQSNEISKFSRRIFPINKIQCDECGFIWDESSKVTKRFDKWNGHFCKLCLKSLNNKNLVKVGTAALNRITKEDRKRNARDAGLACQNSEKKDHVSFTTKRWAAMDDEQRKNQVTKANAGLIEKLKDPVFREKHFDKVFKNSKIGYISKGQNELFESCSKFGDFILDGVFSSMKIDVVNFEKKIAIEFNGDFYHCNPRTWNADDFNKVIEMTASDKWEQDRKRRFFLQKHGFQVIIVWESDWKNNRIDILSKIKKIYNEIG